MFADGPCKLKVSSSKLCYISYRNISQILQYIFTSVVCKNKVSRDCEGDGTPK